MILILLPTGCRTEPVVSLRNHPITTIRGVSMEPEVIAEGIIQAGHRLGWKISRQGANTVHAYIDHDGREAIALITFSERAYSVEYWDSHNFLYDGRNIHKNYKKLVLSLTYDINNELNSIANKILFEKGEIYIKKIPSK